MGNKLLFSSLRNKLFNSNPLGFHSLALNKDRSRQLKSLAFPKPIWISLRGESPEVNIKIAMIDTGPRSSTVTTLMVYSAAQDPDGTGLAALDPRPSDTLRYRPVKARVARTWSRRSEQKGFR